MAKETGKTYLIKGTSPMGKKSETIVHAPDKKAAEKTAKELHPQSGAKIKVSRYKTKGVDILRQNIKSSMNESTESMKVELANGTKDFVDETFVQRGYEQKDSDVDMED